MSAPCERRQGPFLVGDDREPLDLGVLHGFLRQAYWSQGVPRSEEVLLALANYSAELGQRDKALGYAKTLAQIAPGNRAYQQLVQNLSAGAP